MRDGLNLLVAGTLFLAVVKAAPVQAQTPTDFLVQKVCVDTNDQPYFADPVSCPLSRPLRVGEALPYHKIDVASRQISDSFPISDQAGISRAVQTYYFTDANGRDPLFPGVVHFTPVRGGYNIVGADAAMVYFRGTSDPGSYWSPWWTPACEAKGWLLFPNSPTAFGYGGAASPTDFSPQCTGAAHASTVEWTQYSGFTFVGDPAYPNSTKVLDTLAAYHFGPPFGSFTHGNLEITFHTREYGVTRWEAWEHGTGPATPQAAEGCPGVAYNAIFHGYPYRMVGCRSWTRLVAPMGGSWDPDGSPAGDASVKNWTVDPLYTSRNYLANTTAIPAPGNPSLCNSANWYTVDSPSSMTVGRFWQSGADPDDDNTWIGNGNCVPMISTSGTPSGAYAQTIVGLPATGQPYRFGALMWAPFVGGGSAQAVIAIIQRDPSGNLTGQDFVVANLIQHERPFEGHFDLAPGTSHVIFAVYPQQANVGVAVTSAFVAQ